MLSLPPTLLISPLHLEQEEDYSFKHDESRERRSVPEWVRRISEQVSLW